MHTDGSWHLTPEEIADYLDGSVPGHTREKIEHHMTVCDSCRSDMMAGSALAPRVRPFSRWMPVALPTAAAAILATLFLFPPETVRGPSELEAPVTRGKTPEGVQTFAALQPSDGGVVEGEGVQFRWHSVQAEAAYTIMLTDGLGDVVWTGTSPDTLVVLPTEVLLEPGKAYFWYVDALLPGARSATTGIQSFSVER